MLRTTCMAAAALFLFVVGAAAQPAQQPASEAVAITELQARERIDKQGYTAVTGLKQDSDGVWRGSATKDGKVVEIVLDKDGKVIEKR